MLTLPEKIFPPQATDVMTRMNANLYVYYLELYVIKLGLRLERQTEKQKTTTVKIFNSDVLLFENTFRRNSTGYSEFNDAIVKDLLPLLDKVELKVKLSDELPTKDDEKSVEHEEGEVEETNYSDWRGTGKTKNGKTKI